MGRKRTKDFDLAPGWRRVKGHLYYQPTTAGERERRLRRAFELPDEPMVYFVREKNGAVKVGFTTSRRALMLRMASLRTHSPRLVTLLGAVPGTRADEARAHAALEPWRCRGEWFGPCRAVTTYLRVALNAGKVPELDKSEVPVKSATQAPLQISTLQDTK